MSDGEIVIPCPMDEMRETVRDIAAALRGRGEDGRGDRMLWWWYGDRLDEAARRAYRAVGEAVTRFQDAEPAETAEAMSALKQTIGDYGYDG